jgi:hypothetical protein
MRRQCGDNGLDRLNRPEALRRNGFKQCGDTATCGDN